MDPIFEARVSDTLDDGLDAPHTVAGGQNKIALGGLRGNPDIVLLDAEGLACEAGSPRSANIVLMGAASYGLPFTEATWHEVHTLR